MDRKNNIQKGKPRMTPQNKTADFIVMNPSLTREDGEILDVSSMGLQFEDCRINQISTDLLMDLDVIKYNGALHSDVVHVGSLLDVLEQAQRIINRGIYNTLELAPSYSGSIRKQDGEQILVSITENKTHQYSIAY